MDILCSCLLVGLGFKLPKVVVMDGDSIRWRDREGNELSARLYVQLLVEALLWIPRSGSLIDWHMYSSICMIHEFKNNSIRMVNQCITIENSSRKIQPTYLGTQLSGNVSVSSSAVSHPI